MGPEVIQSSNGRRAWEFLDDNPDVALVISDVVMPEMGGRDFITMVRADPRFESLPLLIISAYVGVLGVAGLLDRGASAFLRKPVDLAELTEIIERHLSPIPPSA
ncbi:MAG: response regulator [bacterium]|nr:response regulator [bacterium]MCP5068614.1 response regulator [bacterium]